MKLAEALIERADLQRRMVELQSRIYRNAVYQEGDTPAEDPKGLLREYDQVSQQLEKLIVRINLTNNKIKLENGVPMVEALARRDVFKKRHGTYKKLAEQSTPAANRYSHNEIKMISAIDVASLQKQSDKIAADLRDLDTKIQQANWSNDLKE